MNRSALLLSLLLSCAIACSRKLVLVLYTAPERDYGPGSARVERSLSTLKPTR